MKIVRLTDKQRVPFNHDFIRQTDGQRRNSRGQARPASRNSLPDNKKERRTSKRTQYGIFLEKEKTNKAKAKSGMVGLSRLSEERSDGIAGGKRALRHEIRRLTIKRKDGRAKGRSSGFFLKKKKPNKAKAKSGLVGLSRRELPTSRLSGACSNQLSYNPKILWFVRKWWR